MAGETDALVKSFAGVPELHVPLRGRIKGARAFEAFVSETGSWLMQHDVSVEEVEHLIAERHGFEEVVLHLEATAVVSIFRSRSWPIAGRTGGSTSCGSTSATGRRPAATPTARRCCSPIHSCAPRVSSATISVRWRQATPRRSSRRSNRTATPASLPAASTCTAVATACAPSTSCCSPTAAASRSSTARRSTTAARARWSTTSCAGARRARAAGRARRLRQGSGGRLAAARIYDDVDPPLCQ